MVINPAGRQPKIKKPPQTLLCILWEKEMTRAKSYCETTATHLRAGGNQR